MTMQLDEKEKVYQALKALGIDYRKLDHPAVYTIDEMEALHITDQGNVCKNLFLRDANGKRHFLVVLDKDKTADLKAIQMQVGCSRLSFASETRLMKHLGLTKGSVTPLSVINDLEKSVEVVVDADIVGDENLGFHPNVNTSTVFIRYDDLMHYLNTHARNVVTVQI